MDKSGCVEHVMGFVSASDKFRSQYTDRWEEVLANVMVRPNVNDTLGASTPYKRPYGGDTLYRRNRKRVVLKDGESHKVAMTYVAIIMTQLFGHPRNEYVQAVPVGWEDAESKGPVVTKLMRYAFSLPGHFRTFAETAFDMVTFGTGIIDSSWKFLKRDIPVRTAMLGPAGEEFSTSIQPVKAYDDICLRPVDIMDFYPDPSRYRIQEMCAVAKKFRMNSYEARRLAANGFYNAEDVEKAIAAAPATSSSSGPSPNQSFRVGLDQPSDTVAAAGFKDLIGYDYWGEFPEKADIRDDKEGSLIQRGVATVWNNVSIRRRNWPIADPNYPFHTFIINPVQGRFYGISPAEVIRYDQSFADAMKMLLAEAMIRRVHPPIAVDEDATVDMAALRAWKADTVVTVRGGPQGIGTLRYDADVQGGFEMLTGLKAAMQEDSGALGAIQGQNGPDRESATVGSARYGYAKNQPELACMIIEKECLPPIGQAILRRYQQFLGGIEDLKNRIGELPDPIWIGDIMGDFDIQFVGSRLAVSNQEKLQSYDRLSAMAMQIPAAQAMIPWDQILRALVGDVMNLPEVAAKIADPQTMALNQAMMQQFGAGGSQNGVPTAPEIPGTMPAQAAGAAA